VISLFLIKNSPVSIGEFFIGVRVYFMDEKARKALAKSMYQYL
jgi:hypothetical protein